MRRVEGWEGLLNGHIEQAYLGTFRWGERDCALWAAAWVLKCTGQDFGDAWRGRYKTEAGAARLLRKRGYPDVAAIASEHLPEVPVPLARRGDLVLGGQGCLGVCNGRHSFFLAAGGVLPAETLDCPRAWRV